MAAKSGGDTKESISRITTIINCYGGPGTGKSTSSAFLYYVLKSEGHNAELVRECAKDWAWEGRRINTYDQFHLFGEQARRESLLYSKADWVVTDCPLMIHAYYADALCPQPVSDAITAAARAFYWNAATDGHRHVHVMLRRSKPYASHGRFQDEETARSIDVGVLKTLERLNVQFVTSETDEQALRVLLREVVSGSL